MLRCGVIVLMNQFQLCTLQFQECVQIYLGHPVHCHATKTHAKIFLPVFSIVDTQQGKCVFYEERKYKKYDFIFLKGFCALLLSKKVDIPTLLSGPWLYTDIRWDEHGSHFQDKFRSAKPINKIRRYYQSRSRTCGFCALLYQSTSYTYLKDLYLDGIFRYKTNMILFTVRLDRA